MPVARCSVACLAFALASFTARGQGAVERLDVEFRSDTLRLAGTLYLPQRAANAPAVVLIHGSGEADRSSLRYYAEMFAQNGIVALVYDKRGVGKSQGAKLAWRNFSLADLAADAAAGARFLRTRPEVDATRLGLFGVSQGGWVAPLAAELLGDVRFVITISPSLTTIAEDNLFERAARLRREGFSSADVAAARTMHERDIGVSRTGAGFAEFERVWDENKSAPWFRRVYLDPRPAAADHPYRTWYRSVMDVDPVPVWRRIAAPTLFIFGDPTLDDSSPVDRSLTVAAELKAGGRDIEVLSVVGGDHNLKRGGKDVAVAADVMAWLRRRL
jgi:uncharacterized protein